MYINLGFSLYWIFTSSLTDDFKDTFIHPAIDLMISASESNQTGGTYTINTSTSVTNYTEVSGANTVIYADTRADTSAYTAAGIPETADQPTTINSYYLHRRDAGSTTPSNKLSVISVFEPPPRINIFSLFSIFFKNLINSFKFSAL